VIDFICQVLKSLLNEKKMTNKESLMMFFQSVLGTPYKWGGNNCLEGYDCSGFVQDALSIIGVKAIKHLMIYIIILKIFKNQILSILVLAVYCFLVRKKLLMLLSH